MRQRLGLAMLFVFLPINVPMWKMVFEFAGYPLPWGDLQIFFGFIVLFVAGGMFTFTPKLRLPLRK